MDLLRVLLGTVRYYTFSPILFLFYLLRLARPRVQSKVSLVIQTPLPTASQKYIYWNWKSVISGKRFFENQKIFHFGIKEMWPLQSYIKLFLIKMSADISDSRLLLDSLSKAKIFPNFSWGNSFLFLADLKM